MAKKYTGWGMAAETNSIKHLIIVQGRSRKEAVSNLEGIDCVVLDESMLKHVCIVKYPGPLVVKAMKSQNWDKAIHPIKAGKPKDEKA